MRNIWYTAFVLAFFLGACSSTAPTVTPPPPPPTPPVEAEAAPAPPEEPEPAPEAPAAPEDWFHADVSADQFPGVATTQAYAALSAMNRTPRKTVVVAVIDGGVDIEHEDLQGRIWQNEDEVAGNGVDDDQNGYIDDTHGWNFIGNPNGENVGPDTYEMARELGRLQPLYADADTSSLNASQKAEYAYYMEVAQAYEDEVAELKMISANLTEAISTLKLIRQILASEIGKEDFTTADVQAYEPTDQRMGQAKDIWLYFQSLDIDEVMLAEEVEKMNERLETGLNPEFDPRPIVGDNYADVTETGYGNSDVAGPDAFHGTHVSGIIAATRGNGIGMDGVADHVRIMPVRAVPDGDERDKDVANAIRYAADNGADIINMSFGKNFSPQKSAVDDAVRYAESKGILMIHAAGNDAEDIDEVANFPTRHFQDGGHASLWVEVGASNWDADGYLAAPFSNYGMEGVDLFAPGVDIYSTAPDQEYKKSDGTSMAAPIVSGVAALLMAYYPELTAEQVRTILLESAVSYADAEVLKPGSDEEMIRFGELSATGSVVNALAAVKRAEAMAGQ